MGKISQSCLFLENYEFAWRGFMQGSVLPGAWLFELEPPARLVFNSLFLVIKQETEPLQVNHPLPLEFLPLSIKERSEGVSGFVLEPYVNKRGSKDPSVLFEPRLSQKNTDLF